MTSQFDTIFSGLLTSPGKLRIAPSGLGWKSSDEKIPVLTVPAEDIKGLHLLRVARNYQLKIITSKTLFTFDGFVKDDLERLSNVCNQYYNVAPEAKEISVKGWNWGEVQVQSQEILFLPSGSSSKPAFTIPLALLSNTVLSTKTEVVLDLKPSLDPLGKAGGDLSDAVDRKKQIKNGPDEVVEIRFYIPGATESKTKKAPKVKAKKEEGVDKMEVDGEDEDDSSDVEEDGKEPESAAQAFFDTLKEKSDMGQEMGEALGVVSDVNCLTPRGKFDIELYSEFIRLKGKTYDYKINYSSVQKLYLLEKPDDIHCQLVLNIDPPIRQGQTRYPYLVMQFVKEDMLELDLTLDEETKDELYGPDFKTHYDDPPHEVVTFLIKTLTKKKVTMAGKFQSREGNAAVKCMVKANEGQLYILDKQMLFISKAPLVIHYPDISSVTFNKPAGAMPSSRAFDAHVKLRSSVSPTNEVIIFSNIPKEDLEPMEEYLVMKKIKVKNDVEEVVVAVRVKEAMEDDDDDDDDESDASKTGAGGDLKEEDDEDSEVDEDFQAESDDSGGSGESSDEGDDDAMEMDNNEKAPEKKKQKVAQ